jgi:DNA-binding transcriptional regulator LsrR (DeoR family)
VTYRSTAQWHDLLARLRKPGDTVFVRVGSTRAREVLDGCGPAISQYVRVHVLKGGVRFVRLAERKNLTRQLAELRVGQSMTLPASTELTLATLATRVRREYPGRRYRTHRDRDAGTFSVARTK